MRKIRIAFAVLVCMLLGYSAAICAPVYRIHEIQRPLLNAPDFVLPGTEFMIWLSPDGKTVSSASLVMSGDNSVVIPLQLGDTTEDDALTFLPATVPAEAGSALYDLSIEFNDGSSDLQPHSVKVISEFKKDFDFVHITDIHFNVEGFKGRDMNLIRKRLLQDISTENPEFVVFGGDLGLNPETYDVDYIDGYNYFKENLMVPMYMVPGNHELYRSEKQEPNIDGLEYWSATYGPTYNSFDYGDVHMVGINTFDWDPPYRNRYDDEMVFFGTVINAQISPRQWKWLKEDLASASDAGKNILAFTHIPLNTLQGGRSIGYNPPVRIKGPSVDQFTGLLNHFGVSHIFTGHMHYNKEIKYDNLTEVMTQAAGISGDNVEVLWGYRIVHVKDGKVAGTEIHEISFNDLEE